MPAPYHSVYTVFLCRLHVAPLWACDDRQACHFWCHARALFHEALWSCYRSVPALLHQAAPSPSGNVAPRSVSVVHTCAAVSRVRPS